MGIEHIILVASLGLNYLFVRKWAKKKGKGKQS
jgi:hypothetical protein